MPQADESGSDNSRCLRQTSLDRIIVVASGSLAVVFDITFVYEPDTFDILVNLCMYEDLCGNMHYTLTQ